MAFEVTPTSGGLPYTFTATFANAQSFAPGLFALEFKQQTGAGSCPTQADTGTVIPSASASLLNTGSFVQNTQAVPAGSCRRTNLVIRDTRTGVVSSIMSNTIDNI